MFDSAPVANESASRPLPASGATNKDAFTRSLGALDALAILISVVVGSGIFTSSGSIDTNAPSPGLALCAWLVGGLLAYAGALSLAELGAALPGQEGGVQPFLVRAFCGAEIWGFLAAWTWVVGVMPATLAILSIVLVDTAFEAAYSSAAAGGEGAHKALSVGVVLLASMANSVSTRALTRLNSFFVVIKFVGIAGVAVAGLGIVIWQLLHPEKDGFGARDWYVRNWFAYRESVNPDGSTTDWERMGGWEMLGHFSAALYGALWAYSGWDKALYISAELSAPARQLPLAINTAMPIVILCFVAANTAYYVLLPWNLVSTTDSVAVTAMLRLFGPAFSIASSIIISLVIAGSLLGNSFVAGRMAVAAANKKWLPASLAYIGQLGFRGRQVTGPESEPLLNGTAEDETRIRPHKRSTSDAPINAIVLSAALSTLYILFADFRALLIFNGLGEYTFFFLTVVGVIVLRFREPDLDRPFKPLLAVPVLFALASGFVVVRGAIFAPLQAAVLVSLWGLGWMFYTSRGRMGIAA